LEQLKKSVYDQYMATFQDCTMLTDAPCRNAKPKEKLYRLNDFKGLYLEVKPNGVKA